MSKQCPRCKEIILKEPEHEFCIYKDNPEPKEVEIEFTKPAQKIEQKPITHNIAPLGAKPPANNIWGTYGHTSEDNEGGSQALARKIYEDQ